MEKSDIVAVPELGNETSGAIVYWRLSGVVDGDRLFEAWDEAALDDKLLPETPSPEVAMRRAAKEHRAGRRLVRPLAGRKGWAVVDETAEGSDLEYEIASTVTLDKVGRIKIEVNDPEHKPLIEAIKSAYDRHLDEFSQGDISSWMVELAHHCQAVSLRDSGGFYFIPRANIARWKKMTDAIESISDNKTFRIPAVNSEEAIEAVLDAIVHEAEHAAAEMEKELTEGDLGERALRTRRERCEQVGAKLATYEKLLDVKQDAMHERLDDLKANIAAATLAAMAEMD